MFAGHKALAVALLLLSACAAPAHAQEPAAQAETPRRPQGPAASPVIKLPRSESLGDERATPQPADSRDGLGTEATPRRWEYCSVGGFVYRQKGFSVSAPRIAVAVVRYFGGGTDEVEGPSQQDEEALAAAFAKLGEDGWELAATRTDLDLKSGDGKASTTYFFKRPKR